MNIKTEILKHQWTWTGQTLKQDIEIVTKQILDWNSQWKRKPGHRTTVGKDQQLKKTNATSNEIKKTANNKIGLYNVVLALCSNQGEETFKSKFTSRNVSYHNFSFIQ